MAKQSALERVLGGLGSTKNTAAARKPSSKGIAGLVAGAGLGAAAIAKRRRNATQDEAPGTSPLQPVEPSGAESGSLIAPPLQPFEANPAKEDAGQ